MRRVIKSLVRQRGAAIISQRYGQSKNGLQSLAHVAVNYSKLFHEIIVLSQYNLGRS